MAGFSWPRFYGRAALFLTLVAGSAALASLLTLG